jgi:hypothetical protein
LERLFTFTGDCFVAWCCPCVTLAQVAAKVRFSAEVRG